MDVLRRFLADKGDQFSLAHLLDALERVLMALGEHAEVLAKEFGMH